MEHRFYRIFEYFLLHTGLLMLLRQVQLGNCEFLIKFEADGFPMSDKLWQQIIHINKYC